MRVLVLSLLLHVSSPYTFYKSKRERFIVPGACCGSCWSTTDRIDQTKSGAHGENCSLKHSAVSTKVGEVDQKGPDINKQILSLAIPALAALSIDPLMSLVDTVIVGQWAGADNPLPLASIGSASSLLTFAFYIFNFLCNATAPILSSVRASGEYTKVQEIGGQALSASLVLGVALTAILTIASKTLLQAMGADMAGTAESAQQFLQLRALAAPAVLVATASIGIMRGCLDTVTPIYILLAANVLNLALDLVLILGADLGASGAAMATTSAEWGAAAMFLFALNRPNQESSEISTTSTTSNSNISHQSDFSCSGIRGEAGNKDVAHPEAHNTATGPAAYTGEIVTNLMRKIDSPLLDLPVRIAPEWSLPSWTRLRPLLQASAAVFLRTAVLQACLTGATALVARGGASSLETVAHAGMFELSSGGMDLDTDAAGVTSDAGESNAALLAAHVAAHQVATQVWLLCSFIADALAAAGQTLVADAMGKQLSAAPTTSSHDNSAATGSQNMSDDEHLTTNMRWPSCTKSDDNMSTSLSGQDLHEEVAPAAMGRPRAAAASSVSPAQEIARKVLVYSLILGAALAAGLSLGAAAPGHAIPYAFTQDADIISALLPVLPIVIISQPLNAVVFAADGVVQGAQDFAFQAKSMLVSAVVAAACYYSLQTSSNAGEGVGALVDQGLLPWLRASMQSLLQPHTAAGLDIVDAASSASASALELHGYDSVPRVAIEAQSSSVGPVLVSSGMPWDTEKSSTSSVDGALVHVWLSLVALQLVRGSTSLWRLCQLDNPLVRKPSEQA